MPRPGFPPTPGSSTDMKGKDGDQSASLQLAFELPPPALHDAARVSPIDLNKASHTFQANNGQNNGYPMQAAEAVKARRRSSAARETKESSFALPPPPTRSRKIIQMKPRAQQQDEKNAEAAKSSKNAAKGATSATKDANATAKDASKKKQPSATSAAGRKIARKTAHSLIERRRRSKMNEEFALLKSMIPACTGEMHKLAILQASIEYVRYLEDCVSKLKAQHGDVQTQADGSNLPSIREFHPTFTDDTNGDVDMSDSETATSPAFTARPDYYSRPPSVSPALHAQDARDRQQSYSSVSTDYRKPSYSLSTTTSPAFGPQFGAPPSYSHGGSTASTPGSTLTSPALNPQSDLDQEATAALLMLNNDRRGTANQSGRGMSVRDLLTT